MDYNTANTTHYSDMNWTNYQHKSMIKAGMKWINKSMKEKHLLSKCYSVADKW